MLIFNKLFYFISLLILDLSSSIEIIIRTENTTTLKTNETFYSLMDLIKF